MNILFVIGIAQALFFCFFLLTTKGNKVLKGLLTLWLILISFSLFLNYLYETDEINQCPDLIGLDTAFPFLYMPILYFYAKFLVAQNNRWKWTDALHLIPFIAYFMYVWINFYSQDALYKLAFLQQLQHADFPLDIQISNLLKIGQAVIYIVLVFRIIWNHQQRIKLNFSYTESINLSWLRMITICLSVIYAFKFMAAISIYFNPDSFLGGTEGISNLAIIIFVYVIAFYGLKQPDIFAKWDTNTEENKAILRSDKPIQKESFEIVTNLKYQGSNLSKEDAQNILLALQQYMEEEKPFLQNRLTIKEVAEALEVNTKNLSQVINEHLGLNFFNYINQYRVNEVKKRIIAPEYSHLSLLGIALDCGFNSKSSFNSVFKKQTGKTPTAYKSAIS